MRWLFLFVLVLNVAYVGWEMNQPKALVVVPVVNSDVPKIVLLSEIGQDSVAFSVASGKSTQSAPAQIDKEPVGGGCYTLGPFRDMEKLRAVTRVIKKYVADASYRSHEEREQAMFWVYLNPAGSYSQARAITAKLKKKKVKDYFIISKEPKINGISLGHFSEKNRAYAHAEYITGLGFKPEVEALFKEYTIYWLDYEVIKGEVIPENVLDKHLTGKINRLVRACE